MDPAIEYTKRNKSKIRVGELADVIDKWGDKPSEEFRYKNDKYWEVLRILYELQEEYR